MIVAFEAAAGVGDGVGVEPVVLDGVPPLEMAPPNATTSEPSRIVCRALKSSCAPVGSPAVSVRTHDVPPSRLE